MFLLAVAGVLASACATVPYTGRHQLAIVSDSSEVGEGEQLYGVIRRRTLISPDREAQAIVREVGRRIAAAAGEPDWEWEFTLFADDREANAWALPGGKVGVYTGIFPIARDDAGLATIIGHEVAHAIAHHSGERASQARVLAFVGDGLTRVAGLVLPGSADIVGHAYDLGTEYGVTRPFNRAQESEADQIGLILMAKAGYDPRAAVEVWTRMADLEGGEAPRPEFLSTHPAYGKRLARIRKSLPRAMRYDSGDRRRRPLPRLAALARPDPAEVAMLDALDRVDRLVVRAPRSTAVTSAIARAYDTTPEHVRRLADAGNLTPGETALALAIARQSHADVRAIARDAERRSWYAVARANRATPQPLIAQLRDIARRARAAGARP